METMLEAVVQAFVSAKLDQADTSVALYSVASELQGEALVAKLTKRALAAISSMLKTAPELGCQNHDFPVFMLFSAMAGVTRAVLVHQVSDWCSDVANKMGRRQGATKEHI